MSRPQLHFTAGEGWINDPLGLTWQDGTYHLYFQHVPGQTAWAPTCHWGHAVSPDLTSWQERPVALAPGEGDGGCWSGSVVTPAGGPPVLFYTSVATSDPAVGRVRTARPVGPDLDAWRKDPGTVVELPAGVRATTFRDPFVFREGEQWWMLVGAGLDDGTATALAYVSDDLTTWEYSGPIAQRHRSQTSPVWTGSLWECPQLLRIGDRHVLVVSVWDDDQLHHVACAVGQFADGRFEVASWHRLTWGDSHYAASAFRDRDGRPGLVCWLRGVSGAGGEWTGAISFPYLLTLQQDRPVLELHDSVVSALEASSAVHTVWRPGPGALRLVDASGAEVVRIAVDRDVLTVRAGSEAVDVPWDGGDVRVVLDGPVLELVLGTGVVALSVPPGAVRSELTRPSPSA